MRQFALGGGRQREREPCRQTDAAGEHLVFLAQKIVGADIAREILVAGIAMEDRRGDERAFAVRGASERRGYDLIESAHGTVVGMAAPADIGEQADGFADAALALFLTGKERR